MKDWLDWIWYWLDQFRYWIWHWLDQFRHWIWSWIEQKVLDLWWYDFVFSFWTNLEVARTESEQNWTDNSYFKAPKSWFVQRYFYYFLPTLLKLYEQYSHNFEWSTPEFRGKSYKNLHLRTMLNVMPIPHKLLQNFMRNKA